MQYRKPACIARQSHKSHPRIGVRTWNVVHPCGPSRQTSQKRFSCGPLPHHALFPGLKSGAIKLIAPTGLDQLFCNAIKTSFHQANQGPDFLRSALLNGVRTSIVVHPCGPSRQTSQKRFSCGPLPHHALFPGLKSGAIKLIAPTGLDQLFCSAIKTSFHQANQGLARYKMKMGLILLPSPSHQVNPNSRQSSIKAILKSSESRSSLSSPVS